MFSKHWIETKALFSVENKERELMGKGPEEPELDSVSFDAREVSAFNPSTRENFTVVRIKSGDIFNIDIEYSDFKNELRRALEK